MPIVLFLCLFLLQMPLFPKGSIVSYEEATLEEDSLLCQTLRSEMEPLLEQHISQKSFDAAYVQKAAVCFVGLLDPEKRYFLVEEEKTYFTSQNTFSSSFERGSLKPFWDLFLMKAAAVHRAQSMRKALIPLLKSHEKECSSFRNKKRQASTFAQDEEDLLLYQTNLLLSYLPDPRAVGDRKWDDLLNCADKAMRQEEEEWMAVHDNREKTVNIFHALLLKSFTRALDSHSEVLDSHEAKELKEALTAPEGKFQWEIVETPSGSLLVLTLDCFYRSGEDISAEKDIRHAWEAANSQKPIRGVLLDLRKNRGGFLLEAVKIAGLFIKSGIIVAVEYADKTKRYFRDLDSNIVIGCPTVILTTKYTASAAEIVAQALHDYGVGVIVGDAHTYGKGSVQMQTVSGSENPHEGSSSAYKVTVGEFFGASGISPQLQGVSADIVVPSYYSLIDIGERFTDSGLPTPKREDSFFQDPLTDVSNASLAWFRKYYIPFLQEPQKTWIHEIPFLEKQSKQRRQKDAFWRSYDNGDWRILQRFVPQGESLEGYFDKEQKREALSILQDMVHSSDHFSCEK